MSNPGNVVRGLKAAISNPNNSDGTKARVQERLDQMQESGEAQSHEAHEDNVAIGHKANMLNPNTSEESKERSAAVLEDMGRS